MKLVWKLLRQHISIPQFTGFFIANLVGMVIIMLGIQFYNDTQAVYYGEDSFMRNDYLIVNKTVSTISGLTNSSAGTFSADEINDFKDQPFTEKVGWFTASTFKVRASFNIDQFASFSTEMFFESVPDEFVDITTESWTFKEDDEDIPIILPRNYLDLYNFGYAQSQQLPQLSEGLLGAMQLGIQITGNGNTRSFKGNIAGFSNRLNTILVPQDFMVWANSQFGTGEEKGASRLIIEVNNPADDNITSYLQDNGYETDQSKLDASKTTYLLKIIVGVVMTIGLIISLLAFYILMLSVFLLVEKNIVKLENLLLIGYSPKRVALPYQILTFALNIAVLIIATIILIIVRGQYIELFENFFPTMQVPPMTIAIAVGLGLMLVVSLFNAIAIHSKIMSIWKRKH